MGPTVDVRKERPSVRKRAAAAAHSKRRLRRANQDAKSLGVLATEQAGQLVAETPLERTTTARQADIHAAVDRAASARGSFALDLSRSRLGPYTHARYSRSGRSLLVASERGHVSVADWRAAALRCELFLNETVRDATFLHSDQFFAVAQRRAVFIYDSSGIELHALRNHTNPGHLAFLPHHLLLASASCSTASRARLAYTDTATGHEVAAHDLGARRLNLGRATGLAVAAANGVVHAGHANGVVSLWGPGSGAPLARLLAQPGGVRHLAVDDARHALLTLGHDGLARTWDLRTFRALSEQRVMPLAAGVALSQRSLLAVAGAATVQVWRPADLAAEHGKPYMAQRYHGRRPAAVAFCPFEDVLAVAHRAGMCSMLVPGAGEPHFDSRAPNPYLTPKQAREAEVRALLDKLPAETIALDQSFIGNVDEDPEARRSKIDETVRAALAKKREKKLGVNRAKGKNKISKRVKRKEAHRKESTRFEREKRQRRVKAIEKEAEQVLAEREAEDGGGRSAADGAGSGMVPDALNRFFPKRRGVGNAAAE